MHRRARSVAVHTAPGRARACLRAVLAAAVGAGLLTAGAATALPAPGARADEVTASQDNLRTGWDPHEPGLSPATVGGGSFGQLFSTQVNGQVYAQPVVAGQTVIVATENDWAYGLDAVTGAVHWSMSLGAPWPASSEGCTDLTPAVGVTGTPVYDPGTGIVYLVSEVVPSGGDSSHPAFYLHALNAQSGAEQPGWPVQIQGAPVNDPARPFDPYTAMQRPGLLLMGGSVYAAFGSHCDITPYVGYVVGVSTSSRALTMWSDESGVTDNQAGIWQSGGGLMSDGAGRIFFTSGNGVSPAQGPGAVPPPELAESTVRLAVQSGGALTAADFFSPANAPTLDAGDRDFGAGGPVGLPYGTGSYPDLLVQAGKDGRVFLLNRDRLGGREQGSNSTDAVVSQAGPYQGEWGHPAAFGDTPTLTASNAGSAHDYVYYLGKGDYLRALKLGLDSSGTPVLTDAANSTGTFGYTSGSPVVTSNGTDPSSAVVWEVYAGDATGAGGMLEAFGAVPESPCSATVSGPCLQMIWSAPIGTASKFAIPATDNGRVYVGTRDGTVLGFGSPDGAPLTGAAPADFGQVATGTTAPAQDITVTAATTVTVSAITATSAASPDPFSAGTPTQGGSPVSLPATLQAGDQLTVPVTFSPTAPGGAAGSLSFATDAANFPAVSFSLTGTGTQPGFYARPGLVSFSNVPAGTSATALVTITNGGTSDETVASVTPPAAPFTVTGLPSGTVAAGASVTATVTYQPTAAGTDSSQFAISAGDGTSLTVSLSGTSVTAVSQFTAAPTSLTFGSVPLGTQASQTIDITNTGNVPATVSLASPAVASKRGSAVYSVPQPSNGLHASFTAQIGGGTGANGMTFALLNAAKAKTTSIGAGGAELGFGGLPGIAVVLCTYQSTGYPSGNFVGIATGAANGLLKFAATTSSIPDLRTGTHDIGVSVSGQTVTVTVDGVQVLSPALPSGTVPSSVLPAFTGGTSDLTDNHTVTRATITAGGNLVPPPGGGWMYNGNALMSHSDNQLTRAVKYAAGSVVYPSPVTTAGLKVTFDAQLSGGTGGNGLTFALLDPSQSTSTALGASNGGLGFAGLAGVAVTLVTARSTGYPSSNFIAISNSSSNGLLSFQTYVRGIGPLRTGTHLVTVEVTSADVLIVYLDGAQVLQYAEPGLTPTSLLAFTGSTGYYTDIHTVRSVSIAAAG